ncbi:small multi-drug export protein [Alicyclobacillus fastidiosus]|uniref:Small multi-drug export protein n=1 Tax=Alicyclobacillus fastidiosus TaxID=392011 RepID=A0ABY6ZQJ7_9BACL|nr:small multi-drug export protein [Alicyclobacillus fastidiosus]WAH44722.1 small multi-drug export protein [Alicyclobacillus fastidiosus]
MTKFLKPRIHKSTLIRRICYGGSLGLLFFLGALCIGLYEGKLMSTVSLIGTSIVLEAQPASLASLPLRFHPAAGAMISILANLIPIPLLILTFDEMIARWSWIRRKLQKTERWSRKYGKYGVWILIPLSPILGAYVCIGIGFALRWNIRFVVLSILIGMVCSSFLIAYGGESVAHLFGIHG